MHLSLSVHLQPACAPHFRMCGLAYYKERLPELYCLSVFHKDLFHYARKIALDLIHQFHGFHDREHLTLFHAVADLNERSCILGRSRIKCPYKR